MELTPMRDEWDEILYLNYGKYGATHNNTISARVVYADYSLSVDELFMDIYNSDWADLRVSFYPGEIPDELFDITLDLEEKSLTSADKLVVWISLQNFGKKYVPARLIYIITDKNGTEVHKEFEEVRVYTDNSIIKKFGDLNLDPGLYALKFQVEYAGIVEEFEDGFEIKKGFFNLIKSWFKEVFDFRGSPFSELTGSVVGFAAKSSESEISGKVSKDIPFVYNLGKGNTAEIKSGSVKTDSDNLSDNEVDLSIEDNKVIITTDYSEKEQGFGEDYTGDEKYSLRIPLEKLYLVSEKGVLKIKLIYGDVSIAEISEEVGVEEDLILPVELSITPELKADKNHFKLDEDALFEFEYLTGEELIRQGKSLEKSTKEKQKKRWVTIDETIETFVYDSFGKPIVIEPEIEELREGKFKVRLPKQRQFRAGKYSLKIKLIKGGISYTQEQDFTWGVLALNTHKSIYLENENAFIGIAVLDDEGHMVCDADVILEVIDPYGQKTILRTSDASIKISPECSVYGVTNLPDYYTNYAVSAVGTYIMNLTAETFNGIRTITDEFVVQSTVDFDVARDGPTRIYPVVPYVMNLTIKANKNYNGIITEYVPASFGITPQPGLTIITIADIKILDWDVRLKKDDVINLAYEFDAPDVSPEFYLSGKLDIGTFSEERYWQIASDAAPPALDFGELQVWQSSSSTLDSGDLVCTIADAEDLSGDTCDGDLSADTSYRWEIVTSETAGGTNAAMDQVYFQAVVGNGDVLGSTPSITYCGWPAVANDWSGSCSISSTNIQATGTYSLAKGTSQTFAFVLTTDSDMGGETGTFYAHESSKPRDTLSDTITFTLATPDTTEPGYSGAQTNASSTTYNGTDVQINLTITDGTAVDFYTLSHNDTGGSWTNESFVDAGGSQSVTMIWNYSIENFPTTGGTFGWQVWANDTGGYSNTSLIRTFTVQEITTDSCSWTSGDWVVINGDQCTLSTVQDIGTNKLRVENGAMRIESGGYLRAGGGCYVADIQSLYVDDNAGLYCGS